MEVVLDKHYVLYGRITAGAAALLAILAGLTIWVPALGDLGHQLGLSVITLIISLVHLAYYLIIYRRVVHISAWTATFVCSLLITLNLFYLIHQTGQLESWWTGVWGALIVANGLLGNAIILGGAFLSTLYYLLIASREGDFVYEPRQALIMGGLYLASGIGFLLWHRKYTSKESKQINRLAGMVRNKQAQTEMLIRSISDGIVLADTEGRIVLFNTAASAMTEWPVNEALDIDVRKVLQVADEKKGEVIPDDRHPFTEALKQGKPLTQTLLLQGRKSKKPIISLSVSPVMAEGTENLIGVVGVFRDVSQTRTEEQRRAEFISTASHEMRTPVAAIEGYLALALNARVSQIDSKAREYLEKAHASTQHLGKLFQDLLTSARAEDGRLTSHPVVIEMGAFIEKLTEDLRFVAQKKGLVMEFVLGTPSNTIDARSDIGKTVKPLYYVHADPDRMREVITNLFDNAVKYTESGKVSLGLTGDQNVVQIRVQDTGPGIPAESIPHLFQKFYRVDSSATRTIGGTGLGLFISRKIIELYGGRVWVDSVVGKGSTFYINLPRLSAQKAGELQAAEAANSAAGAQTTATGA